MNISECMTIKLQMYCFLFELSRLWFGSPTPTYSTAARWVEEEGVQRTYHKEDLSSALAT